MNPEWVQPGLLVLSIPLVSGLGAMTAWLGRAADVRFRSSMVVVPACGASLVVAMSTLLSIGLPESPAVFQLGRWLPWHSDGEIGIGISLQWDSVSATWVTAVTTAALLLSLGHGSSTGSLRQREDGAPWMLALLCGAQGLVLSSDFVCTILFWLLTLIAAWRLANATTPAANARDGSQRMLSHIGAAGLPLLLVLSFLPVTFGTFELLVVLKAASGLIDEPRVRAAAALVSFGVVLAGLIRSAQFPFCNWLLDVAKQSPLSCAWTATVGIVPCGVYLLIRFSPFLQQVPAIQGLLFGLGMLSMPTCACLAVTRATTTGAVAAFLSGTIGLVCMGIATNGGVEAAAYLAASAFLGGAALLAITGDSGLGNLSIDGEPSTARAASKHSTATTVCGFVLAVGLVSGVLGQEVVLERIWNAGSDRAYDVEYNDALDGPTITTETTPLAWLPVMAPVVAVFSQLLLGVALFRRLFVDRSSQSLPGPSESETRDSPGGASAGLSMSRLLVVTGIGLFGPPMLLMAFWGESEGFTVLDPGVLASFAVPGLVGLLAAISLLLAWIMYGGGSKRPSRLARSMRGLSGLTERRFYLDEAADFILATPLMLWSKTAQLIDNSLLRYGLLGNPARRPGQSERVDANLDGLDAMILGLLLIGAVVFVLLSEG